MEPRVQDFNRKSSAFCPAAWTGVSRREKVRQRQSLLAVLCSARVPPVAAAVAVEGDDDGRTVEKRRFSGSQSNVSNSKRSRRSPSRPTNPTVCWKGDQGPLCWSPVEPSSASGSAGRPPVSQTSAFAAVPASLCPELLLPAAFAGWRLRCVGADGTLVDDLHAGTAVLPGPPAVGQKTGREKAVGWTSELACGGDQWEEQEPGSSSA